MNQSTILFYLFVVLENCRKSQSCHCLYEAINTLRASGYFCCLRITLGSVQARQNVGPDLDQNCFTL